MSHTMKLLTIVVSIYCCNVIHAQEKYITGSSRDSVNKAYVYVDVMPKTPYDRTHYLINHIHYPGSALAHNYQGRVLVKFIVNEDGSISDVKAIKGVNEELDREAIRVVSSMPNWLPGEKDGKPVKVYFTLPISFKLQ